MRLCLTLLAASLVAFAASAAEPIRIVGSDLLKPALTPLLELHNADAAVKVEASLRGSDPAIIALKAGEADLAIVILSPRANYDLAGLRRYPLGYATAIFIVNRANPVQKLTLTQVAGIFGGAEQNPIARWGDAGAVGGFAGRAVTVRAVAPRTSIAFDFVRNIVMSTPRARGAMIFDETSDLLFRALENDESAIGLSPLPPPAEGNLRTLLISAGAADTPFPPSPENIHLGDYRLRMPVEIIYPRENAPRLRELMKTLYGPGLAADLRRSSLVAVPEDVRAQIAVEFGGK